jgi:fructokinase
MGHAPLLISAVGQDDFGSQAIREIGSLGLDTRLLQRTNLFPTGRACVSLDERGQPAFRIERTAAYDAVVLSARDIALLHNWSPDWLYFGTLFPSLPEGRWLLSTLFRLVPDAIRFYDLNLRLGFDSPSLVQELLQKVNVVKMNHDEMCVLHRYLGLPGEAEAFCKAAVEKFAWRAVCVTLGSQGCAMFANEQFVHEAGCQVEIANTVGAGDAFAAAFMHGLASQWEVGDTARFANRVGNRERARRNPRLDALGSGCAVDGTLKRGNNAPQTQSVFVA